MELRKIAEDIGIKIGFASVNDFWLLNDSKQYMNTAANEFNILTPENQMKWASIRPEKKSYNFKKCDKHLQFAEENDMTVHGHTLVWHNQNPDWLTSNDWTEEELKEILEEHIDKVAAHYKGRIDIWDVVNEAFEDDGSYRESIWYNAFGAQYIENSFVGTREIDPDAELVYNDYFISGINDKSDAVYKMAEDFKERGIPLDGIGFQMHINIVKEKKFNVDEFAENLQRFADLGLDIYITELDIGLSEKSMENLLNQADIYSKIMKTVLGQPAVKAVQTWGYTDKYSWIPNFSGKDWPLLFDKEYNPKPSYYAVKGALTASALTK